MQFTVLLSLYYKESPDYLSDCLKSINNNTVQPTQIVIVYDGPIGNELESVVSHYSTIMPITIVPLGENVGLGNALNNGLKFCNHDIVIRMDTDDVCVPERFEKQISYMENNPDVALLGSAVEEYDETLSVSRGIRFSTSEHNDIKEYSKKRNPFNHMTVVFKKEIIEKVGGYQHHALMEDYNLWLRVIAGGYITHNMNEILVRVRGGVNMLARRKGLNYVLSEYQLAKLKYTLKLDSMPGVFVCAVMRIIPRLLPVFALNYIYKNLRK